MEITKLINLVECCTRIMKAESHRICNQPTTIRTNANSPARLIRRAHWEEDMEMGSGRKAFQFPCE